mgnify:CR=1 FL=1
MMNKKANKLMQIKQNDRAKSPIKNKLYANEKKIYITDAFRINRVNIV